MIFGVSMLKRLKDITSIVGFISLGVCLSLKWQQRKSAQERIEKELALTVLPTALASEYYKNISAKKFSVLEILPQLRAR